MAGGNRNLALVAREPHEPTRQPRSALCPVTCTATRSRSRSCSPSLNRARSLFRTLSRSHLLVCVPIQREGTLADS